MASSVEHPPRTIVFFSHRWTCVWHIMDTGYIQHMKRLFILMPLNSNMHILHIFDTSACVCKLSFITHSNVNAPKSHWNCDMLNVTIPISDYSVFIPSLHKLQVVWLHMYTFLYCFHFHVSQLSPSSVELNQREVNSAQHMQSGSQVWSACAAKWIHSQSYLV